MEKDKLGCLSIERGCSNLICLMEREEGYLYGSCGLRQVQGCFFLGQLFFFEMREAKVQKFINMKQGNMSVTEYIEVHSIKVHSII